MQRPVHQLFGWVKPVWMGRNMGGRVKKSSKIIDIVSYALEMSVNGVICVFALCTL